MSLVDVSSNENIHNRGCHNLWVYNFEAQQARNAIISGNFDSFVEQRLANTRYYNAFSAAKMLKSLEPSFSAAERHGTTAHWRTTEIRRPSVGLELARAV